MTPGHRARGRRSPTRIRRRTPRRCTRGGSSAAGRLRRRGGHRGARAPRGAGSGRAAVRRSRRRGDPARGRRRADRRWRGAGARRRRAWACPPTPAGRGVPASRRSGGGTVRDARGARRRGGGAGPSRARSAASASNSASTPTFMCHSGVSAATKPASVRLSRWTARGRSVEDMGGILSWFRPGPRRRLGDRPDRRSGRRGRRTAGCPSRRGAGAGSRARRRAPPRC